MRFFFYGTLMDAEVRRAVLGARAPTSVEPAVLAGWRCVSVAGQVFPTILPDRRSSVAGVLVRGLDRVARDRLMQYENRDYRLIGVTVSVAGRSVAASMFAPAAARLRPKPGKWDFDVWQRRHKRAALAQIARR